MGSSLGPYDGPHSIVQFAHVSALSYFAQDGPHAVNYDSITFNSLNRALNLRKASDFC